MVTFKGVIQCDINYTNNNSHTTLAAVLKLVRESYDPAISFQITTHMMYFHEFIFETIFIKRMCSYFLT